MVPNAHVVHDHPDDGDVLLERGGEHRRVLAEAAIADQRHDDAIGARDLRAERGRRAEAHRRVAARREDRAGLEDRKLLADAVLVPADIGRDERVARQRRAHVGQDPLRAHRVRIALHRLAVAGDERFPVRCHLARAARAAARPSAPALRATRFSTRERLLEIGDRADRDRIVAADLRGVDVDVDQLRRREVERVFVLPRAAIGFGEPRAEPEDPVGALALVVDELRAPEAGHAENQRMVVGQRALAHQRVRDGKRQVFGEFAHLGSRRRRAGCRRRRREAASSRRAAA